MSGEHAIASRSSATAHATAACASVSAVAAASARSSSASSCSFAFSSWPSSRSSWPVASLADASSCTRSARARSCCFSAVVIATSDRSVSPGNAASSAAVSSVRRCVSSTIRAWNALAARVRLRVRDDGELRGVAGLVFGRNRLPVRCLRLLEVRALRRARARRPCRRKRARVAGLQAAAHRRGEVVRSASRRAAEAASRALPAASCAFAVRRRWRLPGPAAR